MRRKLASLINWIAIVTVLLGVALKVQRVRSGGTIIAIMNPETEGNEFIFPRETPINTTFIANVTLMNVSYLAGWQMNITWDPALLRINGTQDVSIPPDNVFGEYALPLGLKITPNSMFWVAVVLNTSINYVSVTSGTLCQIRFTVIKNDVGGPLSCKIHFVVEGEHPNHTILGNSNAEAILYTTLDGTYEHASAEFSSTWPATAIAIISVVGVLLLIYLVKVKKARHNCSNN